MDPQCRNGFHLMRVAPLRPTLTKMCQVGDGPLNILRVGGSQDGLERVYYLCCGSRPAPYNVPDHSMEDAMPINTLGSKELLDNTCTVFHDVALDTVKSLFRQQDAANWLALKHEITTTFNNHIINKTNFTTIDIDTMVSREKTCSHNNNQFIRLYAIGARTERGEWLVSQPIYLQDRRPQAMNDLIYDMLSSTSQAGLDVQSGHGLGAATAPDRAGRVHLNCQLQLPNASASTICPISLPLSSDLSAFTLVPRGPEFGVTSSAVNRLILELYADEYFLLVKESLYGWESLLCEGRPWNIVDRKIIAYYAAIVVDEVNIKVSVPILFSQSGAQYTEESLKDLLANWEQTHFPKNPSLLERRQDIWCFTIPSKEIFPFATKFSNAVPAGTFPVKRILAVAYCDTVNNQHYTLTLPEPISMSVTVAGEPVSGISNGSCSVTLEGIAERTNEAQVVVTATFVDGVVAEYRIPFERGSSFMNSTTAQNMLSAAPSKIHSTMWRDWNDFIEVDHRPDSTTVENIMFTNKSTQALFYALPASGTEREDIVIQTAELEEAMSIGLYEALLTRVPDLLLVVKRPAGHKAETPYLFVARDLAFTAFDDDFVTRYHAHVSRSNKTRFHCSANNDDQNRHPLHGLGALVAAGAILDDADLFARVGVRTGFVPGEAHNTFTVVKQCARRTFAFDKRVSYHRSELTFLELTEPDQAEYIKTLHLALMILDPMRLPLLLERLQANLDGQAHAGVPCKLSDAYIARRSNDLSRRVAAVATAFKIQLHRDVLLRWEGEAESLAAAVVATDPSEDPANFVTQEDTLTKLFLKLEGGVTRAVTADEPDSPRCKKYQVPPAPLFVGRETQLAELAACLRTRDAAVISQRAIAGIGGDGKTTLAAHYARLASENDEFQGARLKYSYVLWLRAENLVELDMQYMAVATKWCDGMVFKDGEEARQALWLHLGNAPRPALIVFDNFTELSLLHKFLPSAFNNPLHIIVTTRDTRHHLNELMIGTFTVKETTLFVREKFPHSDSITEDQIERLHEAMGGLPLALTQFAGYLRAANIDVDRLLTLFCANQADLLLRGLIKDDLHHRVIATMVTLALARLEATSHDGSAILQAAAFLPSSTDAGVMRDVLKVGTEVRGLDAALLELRTLGLLTETPDLPDSPAQITVHQLTQRCVREYLDARQAIDQVTDRLAAGMINFLGEAAARFELRLDWIPPAMSLIDNVCNQRAGRTENIAQLSNATAQLLLDGPKQPREASRFITHTLKWALDAWDDTEPESLISRGMAMLGMDAVNCRPVKIPLFLAAQLWCFAEIQFGRGPVHVLDMLLELLSAMRGLDVRTVDQLATGLRNCLFIAYGIQGDVLRQKEILQRMMSDVGELEPVQKAQTLMNGATHANDIHDHEQGVKLSQRALEVMQQLPPTRENRLLASNAHFNLGIAYEGLVKLQDARKHLEICKVIELECLGESHVEVARTRRTLADVLLHLKDYRTGYDELMLALPVLEGHFGKNHYEVANTVSCLGEAVLYLFDNVERAEEHLNRAMAIYSMIDRDGSEDFNRVPTLQRLSITAGRRGKREEQRVHLTRVYDIQVKTFKDNTHPAAVQAARDLQNAESEPAQRIRTARTGRKGALCVPLNIGSTSSAGIVTFDGGMRRAVS